MILLFRSICGTSIVRLVAGVIDHQEVFVKTIKEGAQEETIGIKKTREIGRAERARKTEKNIVTTNILMISYYLCLYSLVYRTLITSQTTN